jgi:hypothetical protein
VTIHAKPPPGGDRDSGSGMSSLGGVDCHSNAPKIAPAQSDFLLEAIKTLAAEEVRADTLENIPLTLAISGWRATAILLTLAAKCADAGDFLGAERSRQRAREQFIEANDAFRQFMEGADAAHAAHAGYAELRDEAPP